MVDIIQSVAIAVLALAVALNAFATKTNTDLIDTTLEIQGSMLNSIRKNMEAIYRK